MFLKSEKIDPVRLEKEWRQVLDELLGILGGQTMFEAILGKLTPLERDQLADLILVAAQMRLVGDRSTEQGRMKQIRELCDEGWARLE